MTCVVRLAEPDNVWHLTTPGDAASYHYWSVDYKGAVHRLVRPWSVAMPSTLHEALSEIFREQPRLVSDALGFLDVGIPYYHTARLESADLPDLVPTESRADAVIALYDGAGQVVLAVVVEVQLRRDDSKHYSWPSYLATLRARHSCPVILLVVCANDAVARWCAAPIELGHPGWTLRPLALGPSDVPVIAGEMEARNLPELAVLSALAHGNRPSGRAVVSSAFLALDEMDDNDHARLYADVIVASLTAERLRELEEDMAIGTYEPKHELFQKLVDKGRAEGEAKGEAKSLLRLLALRDIDVPTEYRHRITMCGDSDQLQSWFERAFTATQINDVFHPDS